MVGLVLVISAAVLAGVLILAWARDPLVSVLCKLGALLAVLLEKVFELLAFIYGVLADVIAGLTATLHRVHRDENDHAEGGFWDFFIPILFIAVLGLLGYSDYRLFSARVGPILFNTASGVSESSLTSLLGIYFVLTAVVTGYALSDAFGHVPGGSLIFGLLREHQRRWAQRMMLGAACLMGVSALLLGLWTVEKTALNVEDQFSSGAFQVIFGLLALTATALSAIPAIIGGLAIVVLLAFLVRMVLWLAGMALWIVLNFIQKVLELVVAVLDVPARLGAGLINAFRGGRPKVLQPAEEVQPISRYIQYNPLLAQAAPTVTAALPPPAESTVPALPADPPAQPDAGGIATRPAEATESEPTPTVLSMRPGRSGRPTRRDSWPAPQPRVGSRTEAESDDAPGGASS